MDPKVGSTVRREVQPFWSKAPPQPIPPLQAPTPPPPQSVAQTLPPPPSNPPLSSRSICTRRIVDFAFLEKERFDIGRKIKAQGWEYLCSLDLPTYPNLVRKKQC